MQLRIIRLANTYENASGAASQLLRGLPGMLQQIIESAPFDGRIVMGGYCMEQEHLFTFVAQNKRLNVQFAGGGGQRPAIPATRTRPVNPFALRRSSRSRFPS